MVTRNDVYTPSSESSQCIKICIWFPRHVFKDMVLFSALHSLSKSIILNNRENWDNLYFRASFASFWYQSGVDLSVTRTLLISLIQNAYRHYSMFVSF